MARTIRRQPFSVSTDSSDYTKSYFFNQAEFKGICDQKNDVNIDQQTFAEAKNVYLDENAILTSRPPFKFYDGEGYILDQWLFGSYGIRLHRLLYHIYEVNGETFSERADDPTAYPIEELYFVFIVRCITHDTVQGVYNGYNIYAQYGWQIPVATLGWDFIPKVTCAQVEDKIFIWFAGADFIAFNTAGVLMSDGNTYPYFESAIKYLYFPICKLVINGIESDLETKNFLTETYKRRYQYSALSSVNFEKLAGRQMSVNLNSDMTQSTSKHLYDIIVQSNQDKMMVYPYSPIGSNYYVDIAQTPRATVVLRYSFAQHIIEVSFDGRYFRGLPMLDDMVGNPLLTRDGLWAVAFTRHGLAKCKLVAQDSIDFVSSEDVLSWVVEPYMRNVLINGFPGYLDTLDPSFNPTGYFETIDNFAYVFSGPSIYSNISASTNIQYVYTEWLSGTNDVIWGYLPLIDLSGSTFINMLPSDDIKVHFRYVAPTINHQELGAAVSILTPGRLVYENGAVTRNDDGVQTFFFNQVEENINRTLRNDDVLYVTEFLGNKRDSSADSWASRIYRLSASGTMLVNDDNIVQSGDLLLGTPYPIDISDTPEYDATKTYAEGDMCAKDTYLWRAKCATTGNAPPDEPATTTDTYWEPVPDPRVFEGDQRIHMRTVERMSWVNNETGELVFYVDLDWKFMFLCRFSGMRYRIESANGTLGPIYPNNRVKLSSLENDVVYTAADLEKIFGPLEARNADGTINTEYSGWSTLFATGITIGKTGTPKIYTGNAVIIGVGNTAELSKGMYLGLGINVNYQDEDGNTSLYEAQGFGAPCKQLDVNIMAPVIEAESIVYKIVAGYSTLGKNSAGEYMRFDCICSFEYEYISNELLERKDDTVQLVLGNSQWFRIMPNTDTILTDKYLFVDKELITLPQNGELYPLIDDDERNIANNDNLVLTLKDDNDNTMLYEGNLHKLTDDGIQLASGLIQSGSVVSYVPNAVTEEDYLMPGTMAYNSGAPTGSHSRRFYIERLGIDEQGNLIGVTGVDIQSAQLVRLRAYDETITLPVGNAGNPFDKPMEIEPWEYPAAPDGWQLGDPWPDSFPTYPPIFANADGSIRFWAPGDPLPTGPIMLYGVTNLFKRVQPINIDTTGAWYSIDGTLWTSQVSSDAALELDEYVNSTIQNVVDEDGNLVGRTRLIDMNMTPPDFHAVMNEHYFTFTAKDTGHHLLEVTSARRDENKLFSEEGTDLLLYLPKYNEQKFSNEITALHPLSDSEIGIFTESEVWYVGAITASDGSVAYSKPIKSKIPVGCRRGNQVVTALDGQALIFPTARGITALAPQDFIATTEKTLTYLSDAIQEKYHDFYNKTVMSAALIPEEFELGYRPMIRINTYKYWLLFHRYMDKEILALDTRNGTWWLWTTPYPIRSIMVGARLHVLMQLDFTPMQSIGMSFPVNPAPLMGVSFVWTDKEVAIVTDDDEEFPTLGDTPIKNIGYYDDTVNRVLNGDSELVYENKFVGWRRKLSYASPVIEWSFTSQRLHFGQINNYKAVKGINLNLKGTETMTAKLSTKAFRNLYHPEQSDMLEIKINDLRTFIKRFNIMHLIDFQYKIENDTSIDKEQQHQLMLNSLSIKYEVKERIR